jgi:DNA-binding Lrp family transcriptional regulator
MRSDERKHEFDEETDNLAVLSALDDDMAKDQTDRDLIALLQANARESTANLARKLGFARTTVVARLARLERDGVIVGYTVKLGQDDERPKVQAHVGITLSPKSSREVIRQLQKIPELLQLCSVSGEFDYIAMLRADTTARLDALLDEIGEIDGVLKTTTSVVLAVRIDRGG